MSSIFVTVYGEHRIRPRWQDRPGDKDDAHCGQLAGLQHRRHLLVSAGLVLRRRLYRGDVDSRSAAHTDQGRAGTVFSLRRNLMSNVRAEVTRYPQRNG